MIENAGLGVAMEGSAPDVINVASIVTASNDNNGVAKILEKYI